jgi:hypothetical protein
MSTTIERTDPIPAACWIIVGLCMIAMLVIGLSLA